MKQIITGVIPSGNSHQSVKNYPFFFEWSSSLSLSYSVIDELESIGAIPSSMESRLKAARSRFVELGLFDKETGEVIVEPSLVRGNYVINFRPKSSF